MFYDVSSLKHYFSACGFEEVRETKYLDSQIPFLPEVEREDRFTNAVCVEARKPFSATRTWDRSPCAWRGYR